MMDPTKNTNKIDPVVTSNDAHYSSKRSKENPGGRLRSHVLRMPDVILGHRTKLIKKILSSSTDLVV